MTRCLANCSEPDCNRQHYCPDCKVEIDDCVCIEQLEERVTVALVAFAGGHLGAEEAA